MNNQPVVYTTTFNAVVRSEYANSGAVNGYKIGEQNFRSIASLKTALTTAFAKDLGPYRKLEVSIDSREGRILCDADTYEEVLEAMEAMESDTKITLDELLSD